MRLIQFQRPGVGKRVGLIDGDSVLDLTTINPYWESVYNIFMLARGENKSIDEYISKFKLSYNLKLNYKELLEQPPGSPKGWILVPIHHPDPVHCIVAGTGLTHLGSTDQRNKMHKDNNTQKTDSQKMFEMGLEGGKPETGKRGIQPEWFYKGTGFTLRGHNDFLDIPSFTEDGGEEPEIVGCYIIGMDGIPYRLGFSIANEWSDHVMEKVNYLWLAPSKLRNCSIGPELITDQDFKDIRGFCKIYRDENPIYDSGELLTGQDNMSHTLDNLEDHYFKYSQFRVPGDVHIHFFGTMKLSFGNRGTFQDGDKIQINFQNMGEPLINYVRRIPPDSTPIRVKKG